jgi:hypothetical protein
MIVLSSVILFKIIGACILLLTGGFGGLLLFGSADRLYASVRWIGLPIPKKQTRLYLLLLTFWRVIGLVVLLLCVFFTYALLGRQR